MIKQIGIVGSGQMGAGIALVSVQSGFETLIFEPAQKARERAAAYFEKKGAARLLHFVRNDVSELADCDLVIEAVPEQEDLKRNVFEKLDAVTKPGAILASNTSSISITRIASWTKNPERVIGMHFMNPVPVMKLVELIRGLQTSDETYETVKGIAEAMNKTTVTSKDMPGFIANRILMPMINEAFFALQENLASAEDIDLTMKLGANHPMGPLTLADFIGLDTCVSILQIMSRQPCPLMKQYVDAGWLGKKSGRGVFSYV